MTKFAKQSSSIKVLTFESYRVTQSKEGTKLSAWHANAKTDQSDFRTAVNVMIKILNCVPYQPFSGEVCQAFIEIFVFEKSPCYIYICLSRL